MELTCVVCGSSDLGIVKYTPDPNKFLDDNPQAEYRCRHCSKKYLTHKHKLRADNDWRRIFE